MTTFERFSVKYFWLILIGFAAVFALVAWSNHSHKKWVFKEYQATVGDVPLQTLPIELDNVFLDVDCRSPNNCSWRAVMTSKWMLLQPNNIVPASCGHVLRHLVAQRRLKPYAISHDQLGPVLQRRAGKTVAMEVYIPTFKNEPKALAECPEVTYDEPTQTLKKGGRTLAILNSDQPGLTRPL